MKLNTDNLATAIRPGVINDLRDTLRLAQQAGVNVPHRTLRIIALDQPHDESLLPDHQLVTPLPEQPVPLAARCNWQTLRDSFQIVPDPRRFETLWVIAGSSSGAMYGVHEILSALTGVIWAGVGDEDTLFGPTYELPLEPQRPRFAYRGAYGGQPAWASRQRLNFGMSGMSYFASLSPQQRLAAHTQAEARAITRTRSEHAMDLYLPIEELTRHPDWQGVRDGVRCTHAHVIMPDCPHLNAWLPLQPCYSNVQVRQTIISRMVQCCNTDPHPTFFGLWPHDGVNNWCECDDCVKLTPFEHMYRLGLELRDALPPDHPAGFDLLVYSNMLNLPRNPLPANDRVMALFCPYLRPFEHNIFDSGGPEEVHIGVAWPEPDRINPVDEREYGKLLEQWLPHWQQALVTPALFEYPGQYIDETGRSDHQRYGHVPTAATRESEAIQYASLGLRIAILCGGGSSWPDHFPNLVWAQTLWGNQPVAQLRHRYYTAIAGELGCALADALDAVILALKSQPDLPELELVALREVLAQLPASPRRQAYLDWIQVIRLGRTAWQHRKNGQLEPACESEKELRDYVRKNAHRIVCADHLIKQSEVYEQRAQAQANGRRSLEYTL